MRNMNSRLKRLQSRFPDGTGSFDAPADAGPATVAPARPEDDQPA